MFRHIVVISDQVHSRTSTPEAPSDLDPFLIVNRILCGITYGHDAHRAHRFRGMDDVFHIFCVTSSEIGTIPISFWQLMLTRKRQIYRRDNPSILHHLVNGALYALDYGFRSFTPPLSILRDGQLTTPMILTIPSGRTSPTKAATFGVPIQSYYQFLSVALIIVDSACTVLLLIDSSGGKGAQLTAAQSHNANQRS